MKKFNEMFWKLSRYCFFWMEKRPNIDFFKFQIKIFWVVGFQKFFSWKQAIKHMSSEPENWEHPESLKVLFSDFWPQGYIFALFWQTHKSKYCTNRHDARACARQKYHQKKLDIFAVSPEFFRSQCDKYSWRYSHLLLAVFYFRARYV